MPKGIEKSAVQTMILQRKSQEDILKKIIKSLFSLILIIFQ